MTETVKHGVLFIGLAGKKNGTHTAGLISKESDSLREVILKEGAQCMLADLKVLNAGLPTKRRCSVQDCQLRAGAQCRLADRKKVLSAGLPT